MKIQTQWSNSLLSLKNMHGIIAEKLKGKRVAYLDYPVYFNVGDLLIYLGTEKFFKDYDVNVCYRAEASDVRFNKVADCDVILFQGGGNFGDLYNRVQNMRESIIKNFPNKEVICLPQSIHFNNEDERVRASKVFNSHPNFTFFVRDNESFEVAKSFSHKVVLMPDMAHSLHPLIDEREVVTNLNKTIRILNQRRNDNEAKKRNDKTIKMSFDWDDMITYEDRIVKKIHNIKGKLKFEQNNISNFWYNHSNIIAKRAIDYFLQHDMVYTDRLHGLILSALLGRYVIVSDNSYGKNSRYYNLWLKDIESIKFNNE